jgi:acylglycerol lipase
VQQDGKGIRLQTYRQDPPAGVPVRGLLILLHGLNSHMNHGGHLAHELAAGGILVVGFDYRGFGKSQGARGWIESF